jgi:hypothetical protein
VDHWRRRGSGDGAACARYVSSELSGRCMYESQVAWTKPGLKTSTFRMAPFTGLPYKRPAGPRAGAGPAGALSRRESIGPR